MYGEKKKEIDFERILCLSLFYSHVCERIDPQRKCCLQTPPAKLSRHLVSRQRTWRTEAVMGVVNFDL